VNSTPRMNKEKRATLVLGNTLCVICWEIYMEKARQKMTNIKRCEGRMLNRQPLCAKEAPCHLGRWIDSLFPPRTAPWDHFPCQEKWKSLDAGFGRTGPHNTAGVRVFCRSEEGVCIKATEPDLCTVHLCNVWLSNFAASNCRCNMHSSPLPENAACNKV